MSKQGAFLVIIAVLGLAASESIKFSACKGRDRALPTKVELTPCKTPQLCKFKHGMTVDVKISFIARRNETNLKVAIHGMLGFVPIEWPMPNSDGCKDQGLECPLVAGKEYTYHSSFKVEDLYPKIRLPVRWQLNGDMNQFCFKFPMAIIDGIDFNKIFG